MPHPQPRPPNGILEQVTTLERLLAQARAELALIRAEPQGETPIPSVHQELDAIASQTAAATHAILDACEAMDPLAETLDQLAAAQMQTARARIYEACGFHDLVGQRIHRVQGTLEMIETALDAIMTTVDGARGDGNAAAEAVRSPRAPTPEHDLQLINDPELPLIPMQQADIDRLLAGTG